MRSDARRYRSNLPVSEAVKVVAIAALAFALAGCSFSSSVIGFTDEEPEVTGSIASKPVTLSPALNEEDWRRAKAALGVALDPQGPGTLVSWDNPQSAMKGHFKPTGAPYVKNDEICRDFDADLGGPASASLQGSACRPSGGEWAIKEIKPAKPTAQSWRPPRDA
jgi:surface antigen